LGGGFARPGGFGAPRLGPALVYVAAVALALLAARTTIALWRFATVAPELPLWDEAKYGVDGLRLAAAAAELDVARWLAIVYGLDVWPPLFPIVESLAFLAAGPSVAVARGLMATLFLATVAAAYWAGREIAPRSPAVAVAAAVLVATSPFVQLFGAHVMLELPGALLLLLALAAHARSLPPAQADAASDAAPAAGEPRIGSPTRWRFLAAAGLLTSALFFTKYNYAVLWMLPLAASEAWIACGGPRAAVARLAGRARRVDLRRPWTAFVAVYMLALVAILVTGGGTLRVAGREASVTSIGNPLLLLLVLCGLRAAARPRRTLASWRRWSRELPPRHRVLLRTAALPAAAWLLLPPHLGSFVDFLDNRESGLPRTVETLIFHPRVFVGEYHASPAVGVVVLGLALFALTRLGRATPAVRVLLLAAAAGLAATALHPYKEPRFFFVVAPLLWLAAAWALTTLVESAVLLVGASGAGRSGGARRRDAAAGSLATGAGDVASLGLRRERRFALGVNAVLAAAFVVAAAAAPALAPGLREAFARYTVPATTGPVLDRILDAATQDRALVLGTWNQLSPVLVEWRDREQLAGAAAPELVVPEARDDSADVLLRRLRAGDAPPQVISIELDASAPPPSPEWAAAYAAETAWLEPVRAALAAGGSGYALGSEERFPGTGYRLRMYRAIAISRPPASTRAE
jgi:hypothetical protein